MLAGITMTTLTQCCSMFVRSCSWGQSQGHRVNGAAVAVTKPNCTAYRIEKLADGSWALRRYLLVVGFTACTYLMLLFVFFTFCNKICAMSKYSPRKPKKGWEPLHLQLFHLWPRINIFQTYCGKRLAPMLTSQTCEKQQLWISSPSSSSSSDWLYFPAKKSKCYLQSTVVWNW